MPIPVDAIILGGGVAGLFTLDRLVRSGRSCLLIEPFALGSGQTIWSQGILHGGLKYTLSGLLTPSARAIRDMPELWRRCLKGQAEPDLSRVRVRAEHCWLWRTDTVRSKVGMLGAMARLNVMPEAVPQAGRPAVLRQCPGMVARLPEQVIAPASLLQALATPHWERIVRAQSSMQWRVAEAGAAKVRVELRDDERRLQLESDFVILTAGSGNGKLRESLELAADAMQIRPLRMVLVRGEAGELPELNGHCIDGGHTRVTITSDRDSEGQVIWQVGGELAELGARLSEPELLAHARQELEAVLPGLDLSRAAMACYDAPRAEGRTPNGGRPERPISRREKVVITAWPSKLVLAPRLAEEIAGIVGEARQVDAAADADVLDAIKEWPRPEVALPPWEEERTWLRLA